MNSGLKSQYADHVLRKDWKAAVQTVKAAIELDPADREAGAQLVQLRNKFSTDASDLIEAGRAALRAGDAATLKKVALSLSAQFPEWVELTDVDEALVALWTVTLGKRDVDRQAAIVNDKEQPFDDIKIEEKGIQKLLDKAQLPSLGILTEDDLRTLEAELGRARHNCPSRSDSVKALSDALGRVQTRVAEITSRSTPNRLSILTLSVGTLIAGAAILWAVLQSAHLGSVTDYVKILVECTRSFAGSSGSQFAITLTTGLVLSAASYWFLMAAPRLWNRAFPLRDIHYMIFVTAAIVTFVLCIVYTAIGFIEQVASQDIHNWRDELLIARKSPSTTPENALKHFGDAHPFLSSRLIQEDKDQLGRELSKFTRNDTALSAESENGAINVASNYLENQIRVGLADIQGQTKLGTFLLFVGMLLSILAAMSVVAYRSLTVSA